MGASPPRIAWRAEEPEPAPAVLRQRTADAICLSMDEAAFATDRAETKTGAVSRYEPPHFEVIPLDREITAYAPDGEPLF